MLRKSHTSANCPARSAAAGTSTIAPTVGSPCAPACSAKARASAGTETIGAITQTSAPVERAASATAASWVSRSPGWRTAVLRPRTPSAGLGSSAAVAKGRGLSAPASRVRTTTRRPAKASKTWRYASRCSSAPGALARSR